MDVYLVENKVFLVIGGYDYEGQDGYDSRIAATQEKAEAIRDEMLKYRVPYGYVEIIEKTIED